jgi:prevent-host-death family protein
VCAETVHRRVAGAEVLVEHVHRTVAGTEGPRLAYELYKLYLWDMSKRVSASEARAQFADVLDRVAHKGERVIIERRGKVLGAVISADDLRILERVRELEDEEDRNAAARAKKEKGSIAWALIKRDLGIG